VAVARVIEAVDKERLALAAQLGAPTTPFAEILHRAGYTTAPASVEYPTGRNRPGRCPGPRLSS